MSRTFQSITLLFGFLCTLVGGRAEAVQRAHVATYGLDSNTSFNCSVANPCRFFQAATTVVDPNGEVVVLDSGGYGGVTLTKSIALIAPTGVYAGISVFPGAHGVTIATAGIKVVLRGLTINGLGGTDGISMTSGASLTVENCTIANMDANGITVSGASSVRITDTTIRDNGGGVRFANGVRATVTRANVSGNGINGILVGANVAGITTTADIADSTIDGNLNGVLSYSQDAMAAIKVSVRDSRVVRNVNYGVAALSTVGGPVTLSVSNNMISNNGDAGIASLSTGSRVLACGNTVSSNSTGLYNNLTGFFESAGNNTVSNNGTDAVGVITALATR